eukprot:TRINITY_DN80200_c0_g1_i1.p1 TRINITY_DN80200_c0_g1~~TRINITY_DN80200_c0_g1_i1.p1  ORF type:complete len:345 (+),score=29.56 TRINITY_DN80200_c0_g1_i1:22-1035(+)
MLRCLRLQLRHVPTKYWPRVDDPEFYPLVYAEDGAGDAPCHTNFKVTSTGTLAEFALLEANVGRIYPMYDEGAIKSPSCVRISKELVVTAAHCIPEWVSRGRKPLQLQSTTVPIDFSNTAIRSSRALRGLLPPPTSTLLMRADEKFGTDTCPLSGVRWSTPGHTKGPDLCALSLQDNLGHINCLKLSSTPLQKGERVVFCGFVRDALSAREAKAWVLRATPEELRGFSNESDDDLVLEVIANWFGFAEQLQTLKVLSFGTVLAADEKTAAVTCTTTVCSSGGAYVRECDPNTLVGIHLGLPVKADARYGNFNLILQTHHPAFKDLLEHLHKNHAMVH